MLARPAYKNRKAMIFSASVGLAVTTALSLAILMIGDMELHMFAIGENMHIFFCADKMGRIFMTIVTIVLPLVGIYAFEYMGHYEEEKRFFEICDKAQKIFGDAIRDDLIKYCNTHKKEIPSHLKSVPDQKLTMPFEPKAMMFVYEAINRGIHPRDLGYNCPETFVVFD